tara:strand:- start:247 stop:1170 length:924 start_codon:yes stop_codon:yes gene_type:complete
MVSPLLSKKIFHKISIKSPFQKKKISDFQKKLKKKDIEQNEIYLNIYKKFLIKNKIKLDDAINSYLEMCTDMFNCHIQFLRTGKYPVANIKIAKKKVYNNSKKMTSYMVGLAISQFYWKTHYKMFKHLQFMISNSKSAKSYLEIGPGHGLFSYYTLQKLKNLKKLHIIDISKTSLSLSKKFLENYSKNKKIPKKYIYGDFLKVRPDFKYDIVVCGEVIEHVSHPMKLLKKINNTLNIDGKTFISTCINCPAIDHINQWHTIDEIRLLFKKSKFKILSEKVLPVENVSYKNALKQKITVNYSAVLKKI